MSTMPMENLEQRAREQRAHLHDCATELKWKVEETRENLKENLSLTNQSRQHFVPAAVSAGFLALLAGYAVTGMFTPK